MKLSKFSHFHNMERFSQIKPWASNITSHKSGNYFRLFNYLESRLGKHGNIFLNKCQSLLVGDLISVKGAPKNLTWIY